MSSILRRLLSHNTNVSRLLSPRKFCTAASAAVNRELLEPSSPWLMLPPSFIGGGGGDMVYNFYSPIKGKVVSFNNRGGKEEADLMRDAGLAGSSHGWLALYNSRNRGLYLCNPLSGRRIDLPPYTGKPFRDNEVWPQPGKVMISGSPDDEDCRAIMILGTCDRVAFCRPGRSYEWAPLGRWYDDPISAGTFNGLRFYRDFVYSAAEKKFFGFLFSAGTLVIKWELEGWDITDPVRARTVRLDRFGVQSSPWSWLLSGSCLVSGEQPDQLFLVQRHFVDQETVDVRVYRIKDGDLELCSSLDDLVMFVGINQGLAVKASRFPELKPNSIYFTDSRNATQYIGTFDYQNKTCSPLYYPSLHLKDPTPQPWITPTLD